jgi:hypothetical protein
MRQFDALFYNTYNIDVDNKIHHNDNLLPGKTKIGLLRAEPPWHNFLDNSMYIKAINQ